MVLGVMCKGQFSSTQRAERYRLVGNSELFSKSRNIVSDVTIILTHTQKSEDIKKKEHAARNKQQATSNRTKTGCHHWCWQSRYHYLDLEWTSIMSSGADNTPEASLLAFSSDEVNNLRLIAASSRCPFRASDGTLLNVECFGPEYCGEKKRDKSTGSDNSMHKRSMENSDEWPMVSLSLIH